MSRSIVSSALTTISAPTLYKMTLIDGKKTAAEIKAEIKTQVSQMVEDGNRPPHLVAILVGHNPASEVYVANKQRACTECGIKSTALRFDDTISEAELIREIHKLNEDKDVDGFIVQLPLPQHISEENITNAIDYRKDIDGFNPVNVGRQSIGIPCFHSATPAGIVMLLERYGIETSGANCVVLGRSNIVGKPMAEVLMQKGYPGDCTVTVCHRKTRNLAEICRKADILISAMGQPEMITADMVKDGAVVIDVGITRVDDPSQPKGYRLAGDVRFEEVAPKCSFITPVPGGVGPMTIVSLLRNVVMAATHAIYK